VNSNDFAPQAAELRKSWRAAQGAVEITTPEAQVHAELLLCHDMRVF
jgi:hypothetical protein